MTAIATTRTITVATPIRMRFMKSPGPCNGHCELAIANFVGLPIASRPGDCQTGPGARPVPAGLRSFKHGHAQ